MPFPEIAHTRAPITESPADALVLVLPPLGDDVSPPDDWPGIAEMLTAVGFTGARGSVSRVFLPAIASVPVIVAGSGAAPDESAIRDAVGAAVRSTTGFASLAVSAPLAPAALWAAAAEGAVLGGYRFAGYKSEAPKPRAERVTIHADLEVPAAEMAAVRAIGAAVALVKDLVSIPAEWLSPADAAERATEAVAGLPVEVEVLDEDELAAQGFGGVLGVGQGSDRPPRVVRLDYAPAGAGRHVALVGKGITFDTGGLSLKPAASMVGMKYDMAGAATTLAAVFAAASLELPVRVSAWLCLADNMPSGRATRPGDVLRMLDGTTVEVLNTDAEGRLVLADGLVAASRTRPDVLVDVATLTGAIIVALGHRHTGVMGDDEAVARYLAAAEKAGEPAWHLPLPAHMADELDSPIADMQNAKIGDPSGGSLFAGLFLQRFVGRRDDDDTASRIPWVHLDIAGSGTTKAAFGATDKGPTGATVRSLVEFIRGEA
ncbi:leucyl aminopeptidase [Microbacterium radiodurans]|uniref:Probable cytosol aminopeptidase n=1 Tax=Microbacterium radiodurans TaxID=661398 RepID=A0A5J5ITS2_9MICO|nr:leucyl aminopeptidase [Microbacterium radiodurans]KAA9087053.1 leucyl aminopeptidase [Microbacterium radiodurans]